MNVHDFKVKTNDGAELSLSQYRGKALLIVNTASECGYTPQYKGLEELYQAYKGRGLVVLAFPSNDFGGQEPGSNADALYRYLTTLPANGGEVTRNFNKFLVDPKGVVVAHLDSSVEPASAEMKKRIEAVLPAK